MDPFSDAGELFTIHNLFYQGSYKEVLLQPLSGYSDTTAVQARIYHLRAKIALGDAATVLEELEHDDDIETSAGLQAVKALALYKAGEEEDAVELAESLADSPAVGDDETVLVLSATVLQLAGRTEDALSVLSKHQGSLAAVALVVQIRLTQNRTDLALKEIVQAKKWGQDNLLVNLAEAWVGLQVGGDKYQDAFYIYEELAQAPSSANARAFIGEAIANIQLGRLPEAEDAINSALEREPTGGDVLANAIVLATLVGKDYTPHLGGLKTAHPDHALLADLGEKSQLFDSLATQYSAAA
ncbi:coatomer epsilon subunit-domain-containing protein [Dipodascopsis tothii]|uniref:coatomer epsilon subunit-domain-containing protein n=1 Tax=Dipodascopsis tothii TaxID=44089 RepID=UPI0034CEAF80